MSIAVLIALIYFGAIPYIHHEAKKFSPEKTATMDLGGGSLKVDYSSPSKKGRTIFGELVPFGKIWRTGANEPSKLKLSTKLYLQEGILYGRYLTKILGRLFSIPKYPNGA